MEVDGSTNLAVNFMILCTGSRHYCLLYTNPASRVCVLH